MCDVVTVYYVVIKAHIANTSFTTYAETWIQMEKWYGPHGMLGAIHVLFLVQWLSAPAKDGLFGTHSLAYKCHVFLLFGVRIE